MSSIKPSALVKAVYHQHIDRFGEPDRSIRYDNNPEKYPPFVDVMVWYPEDDLNMTTFSTIGMSGRKMKGVDYRVELHMSVQETLSDHLISDLTIFLANLSLYPFMNNTFFDWWHTMPNVGRIPGYESTASLLLHPAFVEGGWDVICSNGEHVKLLNVIPITKAEQSLSREKGIDYLLDQLEEQGINYFERR